MGTTSRLESFVESVLRWLRYRRLIVWKDAWFHPSKTFKKEAKSPSLKRGAMDVSTASFIAVLFSASLSVVISVALIFALGLIPLTFAQIPEIGFFSLILVLAASFAGALISVVLWLINSAFAHILSKLLGGKGKFKPLAYAYALIYAPYVLLSAPFAVLFQIPCLGYFFLALLSLPWMYSLYLQYKAVREVHGLSVAKSVFVAVLPLLLLIFAITASIVLFFAIGVSSARP